MNYVHLKGRLTKDVELRGEGDKAYCFMTLACDRPTSKVSDFVECKAFSSLAQSCSATLKKGCLVELWGSVKSSNYEKDGRKIYTQSIVADDIALVNKTAVGVESKGVRIVEDSVADAEEN